MDHDYTDAYKGWSIIVTTGGDLSADAGVRRFIPSVAIRQLQGPEQRFVGVAPGAEFLGRADALRHGIVAAKAFIDALVDRNAGTGTGALGRLVH